MCLISSEKNLIQLSGLEFFLASSRMELIKVICGISACFHGYTVSYLSVPLASYMMNT